MVKGNPNSPKQVRVMKLSTNARGDQTIYESQLRSDQDWYTTVIEDEWWVRHATPFYEKYYYSQQPPIAKKLNNQEPTYSYYNAQIVDHHTHYVVTIDNNTARV